MHACMREHPMMKQHIDGYTRMARTTLDNPRAIRRGPSQTRAGETRTSPWVQLVHVSPVETKRSPNDAHQGTIIREGGVCGEAHSPMGGKSVMRRKRPVVNEGRGLRCIPKLPLKPSRGKRRQ
jgi:hypothetical protein